MGLTSTIFTKLVPKATEFGEIRQHNGYCTPFKIIRSHRCWYQWKARMRLSICE